MKRVKFQTGLIGIMAASLLALIPGVPLKAQPVLSPQLRIDQIRLTTDQQFVRLHNAGAEAVNLQDYELFYQATTGTNKMFVFLPLELAPGESYLMSEGTMTMCYPAYVDNVSLGFAAGSSATTGGGLQLWRYADSSKSTKLRVDDISWRNKIPVTADITKLPATNPESVYFRRLPEGSASTWQAVAPDPADACGLIGFNESSPPPVNEEFSFAIGNMPPVKHVQMMAGGTASIINRNPGKAAPIINEVLPNPASPQTDADDEFIELYNPNDTVFDLTGFKLAFGSTSPKRYTFPEGTVLQPKEFKAFTSGDTSISLSNSEAQVWLLDPNEKVIGQSEPYKDAKDGQAWALDNGKWTWTLQATPGRMNEIAASVTSSAKGKTAAATLGISTTGSTSADAPAAESATKSELDDASPVHPGILAGVGLAALAYSCYEYRQDLSNKLFQFRRYLRNRQAVRSKV